MKSFIVILTGTFLGEGTSINEANEGCAEMLGVPKASYLETVETLPAELADGNSHEGGRKDMIFEVEDESETELLMKCMKTHAISSGRVAFFPLKGLLENQPEACKVYPESFLQKYAQA